MSANLRAPPPLPPKPPRLNTAVSTTSNRAEPRTSPVSSSRRPALGSTASSLSLSFSASATSWAIKAKSGLNNYAKPMAKAVLANASNYVEAASDYLSESKIGDDRSRGMSGDDSRRASLRKPVEPHDKLNLLPQWAVYVPRKDKAGNVIQHESGSYAKPVKVVACTETRLLFR
ncbi:hypothetical protein QFC19_002891 [Naganishia cerealis]|uniref:Uncharacterized protein n=1 Tax=Naganishia cerealis TaxID=610337 RepID=A0ACC2W7F7_9TREE|nr:hypothetical protein QFC19_002891 [Naganishia cerealis]